MLTMREKIPDGELQQMRYGRGEGTHPGESVISYEANWILF